MVYYQIVIRRLYINNYRCLAGFELPISGLSSALLIGKNGAGKSSVRRVLEVLQTIGRGTSRVGSLLKPEDFTLGNAEAPMRFQIVVELESKLFEYEIAFELPPDFRELRVFQERLSVSGDVLFDRKIEKLKLLKAGPKRRTESTVDWHFVALPILQALNEKDPIAIFRTWLARMIILSPVPSLMTGESSQSTLQPCCDGSDFGAWFTGLMAQAPSAYSKVQDYVRLVIPDLLEIRNPLIGRDAHSLNVSFQTEKGSFEVPFRRLSDGEKCYMLCGLVLAASSAYGPLLCFWDEPDSHLALSEVEDFVLALRRNSKVSGGQFIATSHSREAIQGFPEENTFLLDRPSHLEPTIIRSLPDLHLAGDTIAALIRGDLSA